MPVTVSDVSLKESAPRNARRVVHALPRDSGGSHVAAASLYPHGVRIRVEFMYRNSASLPFFSDTQTLHESA